MKSIRGDTNIDRSILALRVIPRAKHNQVIGFMPDGRLKIKIKSPPVEGKANEGLKIYLAKVLGLKKGAIEILSGHFGRNKRLQINGLKISEVKLILTKLERN